MPVDTPPRSLRQFITRVVLFALPLLAAFAVLEAVIDDAALYEESAVYRKVRDFVSVEGTPRVVVFGSSHADNAIGDSQFPLIANLANQGQDIRHDHFLYTLVRDRMHSVKTVILTLSYFSFRYDEEKLWPYRTRDYDDAFTAAPRPLSRGVKPWIFDRSDLINYNLPLPAILNHYVGRATRPAQAQTAEGGDVSRLSGVTALRQDAVGRAVRAHRGYFNVPASEVSPFLDDLIRDNQRAGRRILAIIPPFHRAYLDTIDGPEVAEFYREVEGLTRTYGIPVVDYSRDPRFVDRDDLFMNSDHLNRAGARAFTSLLLTELQLAAETPRK